MGFIFKRKIKEKALVCGLDNAGKTAILSFLETGQFVSPASTTNPIKVEIEIENTTMTLMDMGGAPIYRSLWQKELQSSGVLVYVIDRNDALRFEEVRLELEKMIPSLTKRAIPLVILANKSDLSSALTEAQLIKALNLHAITDYQIFQTSARTGYGLTEAFTAIFAILSGEPLKKRIMAQAISIFNNIGNAVYSFVPIEAKNNFDAVRGSLFAAITDFCTKFECDSLDEIVLSSQTILLQKSKNFIGTLIWSPNLGIKVADAKDALKELIDQLEQLCPAESDQLRIKYYVDQFITEVIV